MFFMCENKQQQQQFVHRKPRRHVQRKSTTLNFAHQGQNSFDYVQHDVDNDADISLIN